MVKRKEIRKLRLFDVKTIHNLINTTTVKGIVVLGLDKLIIPR